MFKSIVTIVAAALLGGSGAATAASIIELRGHELDQPIHNDIEINGQRVKITVRDAGQSADIQFDAGTDTAYVIDHEQKTYMTLSEQGVEQMGSQLKNMMDQIRAQMDQATAGMSDEQKANLGGLLEQMGVAPDAAPAKAADVATFTASGEMDAVSGIPCRRGTLTVNDQTTRMCVARRGDIALPDADYATLRELLDFGSRIAGKVSTVFPGAVAAMPSFDLDSLDGLPVAVSDPNMRIAVSSLRQEARPPIALPEGYSERANPFLTP